MDIKHKTEIPNYSLEELAEKVGDLRYDSLEQFLLLLSNKIISDSLSDKRGGREKLASHLLDTSNALLEASTHIKNSWNISRKHMSND